MPDGIHHWNPLMESVQKEEMPSYWALHAGKYWYHFHISLWNSCAGDQPHNVLHLKQIWCSSTELSTILQQLKNLDSENNSPDLILQAKAPVNTLVHNKTFPTELWVSNFKANSCGFEILAHLFLFISDTELPPPLLHVEIIASFLQWM